MKICCGSLEITQVSRTGGNRKTGNRLMNVVKKNSPSGDNESYLIVGNVCTYNINTSLFAVLIGSTGTTSQDRSQAFKDSDRDKN